MGCPDEGKSVGKWKEGNAKKGSRKGPSVPAFHLDMDIGTPILNIFSIHLESDIAAFWLGSLGTAVVVFLRS